MLFIFYPVHYNVLKLGAYIVVTDISIQNSNLTNTPVDVTIAECKLLGQARRYRRRTSGSQEKTNALGVRHKASLIWAIIGSGNTFSLVDAKPFTGINADMRIKI